MSTNYLEGVSDYDVVMLDGHPIPGVLEPARVELDGESIHDEAFRARVLEVIRKRFPRYDMLEARAVSDDELEVHVIEKPRLGPIEVTLTVRGGE